MKLRTQRIICTGVVVLLLVAISAVKAYFLPITANPIIISRIQKDYAQQRGTEEESVRECYGVYNGCVPVVFDAMFAFGFWEEEVAGFTFFHTTVIGDAESGIRVWRDGEFMSLREAYAQGYLSKEDIEDIWKKSLRTD